MPAYKPMEYPKTLTKAYWDKQMGLIAKAAGATGVGEAAKSAEDAFAKIDREVFDVVKRSPTSSSPEKLKEVQALKPSVVSEFNKSVKPTIAALKELSHTAAEAAKSLDKSKLTKGSAKTAGEIANEADHFSVGLALNGIFFTAVAKECETSVEMMEKNLETIKESMSKTREYLANLLEGLGHFRKVTPPTMPEWDKLVKQQGRSVSNNLKGNPDLAKKYLKTWTTKFQRFDWGTIGFADLEGDKLETAVTDFVKEVVKEAAVLRSDLGA
jgi:hypothetical protein